MKTATTMQTIITRIAQKHSLDLTACEANLRLEQDGYQPLVIEKVGQHLVSVAHYYQQNGDTVPDPDVVFFTGYGDWVPMEISQALGYTCAAWLSDDGQKIERFQPRAQADIASFCRTWAKNIRDQKWLEEGTKAE